MLLLPCCKFSMLCVLRGIFLAWVSIVDFSIVEDKDSLEEEKNNGLASLVSLVERETFPLSKTKNHLKKKTHMWWCQKMDRLASLASSQIRELVDAAVTATAPWFSKKLGMSILLHVFC